MTSRVIWSGLPRHKRKLSSKLLWSVCALYSTRQIRRKPFCERFGNYLILALRPWTISRLQLPQHGCQCTSRAPSTGCHEGDLSLGHERGQRLDEGAPANRELDGEP